MIQTQNEEEEERENASARSQNVVDNGISASIPFVSDFIKWRSLICSV